jgi:hypothetical protein
MKKKTKLFSRKLNTRRNSNIMKIISLNKGMMIMKIQMITQRFKSDIKMKMLMDFCLLAIPKEEREMTCIHILIMLPEEEAGSTRSMEEVSEVNTEDREVIEVEEVIEGEEVREVLEEVTEEIEEQEAEEVREVEEVVIEAEEVIEADLTQKPLNMRERDHSNKTAKLMTTTIMISE